MDKDTKVVIVGLALTVIIFLLAVYFRLKG